MTQHDELLDLARRHVADGRCIVTHQRALVERLKALGKDTTNAEQTLQLFEGSQEIFEDHLRTIAAEHKGDGR